MSDIMVDIETLSTHTSNAVILSVGAVKFDLFEDFPVFHDEKMWVLDAHEQIAAGRDVSQNTLKFWADQPPEAREHWACAVDRVPVHVFANEFREFCSLDSLIWAHGICFDINNIESLYCNDTAPWRYNKVRDCRTIVNCCAERRQQPGNIHGSVVAHNPMSDCYAQIWSLWEHWPEALDIAPRQEPVSVPA